MNIRHTNLEKNDSCVQVVEFKIYGSKVNFIYNTNRFDKYKFILFRYLNQQNVEHCIGTSMVRTPDLLCHLNKIPVHDKYPIEALQIISKLFLIIN